MKLTYLTTALSFAASPIMAADEMTSLLDWFISPDQQADRYVLLVYKRAICL